MYDTLSQKYGAAHGLTLNPAGAIPGQGASNGAVTTVPFGKFDVDNPMLWLVGIGAATLGLVFASTSVRVGPLRASVSAGKS